MIRSEVAALDPDRLGEDAVQAARRLLGALLVREDGPEPIVARVVETEAYRQTDPASHSARGRTAANDAMFRAPGTAYVYRIYGMHWCLNVAVEPEGQGAAVLLRAARVLQGEQVVRSRRPAGARTADLLRGPGRLTAGLDVDGARHDGTDLSRPGAGLWLGVDGARLDAEVVSTPRVGVRLAADRPWRFHLAVPEASVYRRHPRAGPTPPEAGPRQPSD